MITVHQDEALFEQFGAKIAELAACMRACQALYDRCLMRINVGRAKKTVGCFEAAALAFGTTPREIRSSNREERNCLARFAVMASLRSEGWPSSQIARLVRRDKSAVVHGIRTLAWRCELEPRVAKMYQRYQDILSEQKEEAKA
jgi:hypothetical protein